MPARIRLQRKGTRNNPYFLIAIQSEKTNPQGKIIELVGYYYPDRWSLEQKAVLLNRPRLKYWLGVGAEPTKGIIKLFGKVGFLPKRPPPFGFQTLYEKPEIQQTPQYKTQVSPMFKHMAPQILQREKINDMIREDQANKAVLEFKKAQENPQMMEEMVKQWEKYNRIIRAFEMSVQNGSNAQRIALIGMMSKSFKENSRHITNKVLMNELKITQKEADEILQAYRDADFQFNEGDLEDFKTPLHKRKLSDWKNYKTYFPSKNPITPPPDLKDESLDHLPRTMFESRVRMKPTIKTYGVQFRKFHSVLVPYFGVEEQDD